MVILMSPKTLAQAEVPQEDIERQHEMRDAWKAYRGKLPDPLKVEKDQPNDNVKTNRCAPIVNKTTSFLFGQTLKVECGQQKAADMLWGDDDEKMTRFSKMSINGGAFGHVFTKLIPNPKPGKAPRIVILNPQLLRMITHPDDCELKLAYIIEYPGTVDLQKKQIITRVDPNSDIEQLGNFDPSDTWRVCNYQRRGQYGVWVQVSDDEWPYPFAPVFDWQNLPNPNEAWGTPDLTADIVELNKVLNFVQSNLSRIIKYHGHPKTIITGARAQQIEVGVGEAIVLPNEQAKAANLAPMENFKGILDVIGDFRGSMDELSRIPSAMERIHEMPKGNISGVALRLFFQSLMDLTVQKQRLYGAGIRQVTRAGLVLMDKLDVSDYEDYKVELPWQNLLPIDDNLAAQTALILKQLGVSDETVFAELGYDSAVEMAKSADEDNKKMQIRGVVPGMQPPQPGQPGMPPAGPGGMQQQQGGGQAA